MGARHPEVLQRLIALAEKEHTPVREGTFHDRAAHEKDRRAKWGENAPQNAEGRTVEQLPTEGLIPSAGFEVVRASSESTFNGKLARNAIDGDPRTHWHTSFRREPARHPHELAIDLGATYTIRGVYYLARQDRGWNGTVGECEVSVGDSAAEFGDPAAKVILKKTKKPQAIRFAPIRGRFIRLRALSEINGGPWASVAELGVIGQ